MSSWASLVLEADPPLRCAGGTLRLRDGVLSFRVGPLQVDGRQQARGWRLPLARMAQVGTTPEPGARRWVARRRLVVVDTAGVRSVFMTVRWQSWVQVLQGHLRRPPSR